MILDKKVCVISSIHSGITSTDGFVQRTLSTTHRIHNSDDKNRVAYDAARALVADYADDAAEEEDDLVWRNEYNPDIPYQRMFNKESAPVGLDRECDYRMRVLEADSHDIGEIEYVIRISASIPMEGGGREYCNTYWHASTATDVCTAVLQAMRNYSEKHTGLGLIKVSLDHAILQRSRTINGVTKALKHITNTGVQFHVEVFVVDGGERMGGAHETVNLLEPLPGSFKIKPPKN